ncbi:MAG: class II fructose-1,6-bisphosphate aldolase [Dethiobacteria bacterium]|nr:class II fructose-1,6-bisphosphate aldolase [Bacillota bacterium]HOL15355.1 class II fructose-1,6-bisphosphate aldolase [Bacillota bacterium]
MPLVSLNEVLGKADREGYAVGAFNCNNMEIVQAIARAAEEEKSPVIIQASQGAIRYAGLQYIIGLVNQAAAEISVPVVLHLDHGTSFEQVIQCIRHGFSSVMIDGSQYPLEENIRLTRKVVEIAHAVGVTVEGELGRIGGTEDDVSVSDAEAFFTDPEEAKRFVEETGVDALAISIGTAHGRYKGEPRLDFERLKKIDELVPCPIVLHGSSGVPDESIKEAVRLGVRKINIDTNIREAFVGAIREYLPDHPDEIDPRNILKPAREATTAIIREKIRLFGSASKA